MNKMQFQKDPILMNKEPNVVGTSYQGKIRATYDTLVEAFGDPTHARLSEDGKTNVEWDLFFETAEGSVVATIYDWKTDQDCFEKEYDWHIGGHDFRSTDVVYDFVEMKTNCL